MTQLCKLIQQYRNTPISNRRSKSTKQNIDRCEKYLGKRKLKDLSAQELNAWARSGKVAPTTALGMYLSLSAVLATCHDGLNMKVPNRNAPKKAIRGLRRVGFFDQPASGFTKRVSDEVIQQVIYRWSSQSISPDFIWVLVDTAMRSGELTKLDWNDVDLRSRSINIRDRKHPTSQRGNHQTIPMLGRSYYVLKSRARIGGGRVMQTSQSSFYGAWKRSCEKAGYTIRLHDLRHEGISRLTERGFSAAEIQAVSGHRDLRTLSRYTHISPEHLLTKYERSGRN